MLYATLASSAALLAVVNAATRNIELWVSSSNDTVNGKGLSSTHEGAGINYVFAGTYAQSLIYDDSTGTITTPKSGSLVQTLSAGARVVQLTVAGSSKATIADNVLSLDGNSKFFLAMNINDPYNLSTKEYFLLGPDGSSNPSAIPVEVIVKDAAPAPSSSGYANSTVTSHSTVTDFTTYCPESTVIVVKTCTEVKCQPVTTTLAPGTHTITGSQVPTSTVASESTAAPTVTSHENGAASKVVGAAAGLAAAAAMLI